MAQPTTHLALSLNDCDISQVLRGVLSCEGQGEALGRQQAQQLL